MPGNSYQQSPYPTIANQQNVLGGPGGATNGPGAGSANLQLGAGAVTNGQTYTIDVSGCNFARVRARIKLAGNATGTLSTAFRSPDNVNAYVTGNPADVVLGANGEGKVDIDNYGEDYIRFTFVCSASGTVTFFDVSRV